MTRRFAFSALVLAALLCAAVPAHAFETPPLTPEQRKAVISIGSSFRVIANMFKCQDFAWGDIAPDGRTVTLKYLPLTAESELDKTARVMTIVVYAMPHEAKENADAMAHLMRSVDAIARQNGHVIKSETFVSTQHQPAMFLETESGAGTTHEHSVGVVMRTARDASAFIQVQASGILPLLPGDAAQIRKLPDISTLPPRS